MVSDPSPHASDSRERKEAAQTRLLLFSVLVVATCGLVYELISATMASYLLGDSVTQFSLVIGVYLSAMGLGSWLSKFINDRLHERFIGVQLTIALLGGFSAAILFLGFGHLRNIHPLLYSLLIVIGTLVGLEIPLLMRLMPGKQQLKEVVARVLAFDYIGALAASLLFPLVTLPHLGIVRSGLVFGLLNALVALWCAHRFREHFERPRLVIAKSMLGVAILLGALGVGRDIETFGERQLYDSPVIFSEKTPYQRLSITRWSDDIRLYIDGNLQFSSLDEHRYHESLVHPAFAALGHQARDLGLRVLVLGGGDGMAVREILRYPEAHSVDLVDLDPAMTKIFRDHPSLSTLNDASLSDPRVTVHNADAMLWLEERRRKAAPLFDVIIVDLPDPNNYSLGKLYTRTFYHLLGSALAPEGAAVVQSTSPYLSPRAFWCIIKTLAAADLNPLPYHAHVPSFGDWGFALLSKTPRKVPTNLRRDLPLRYLDDPLLPTLFTFPQDTGPREVEVNRLSDQQLVRYYEQDLRGQAPATGVRH